MHPLQRDTFRSPQLLEMPGTWTQSIHGVDPELSTGAKAQLGAEPWSSHTSGVQSPEAAAGAHLCLLVTWFTSLDKHFHDLGSLGRCVSFVCLVISLTIGTRIGS